MNKINFDAKSLLSLGVAVGTGVLGLLKIVDDKNKKEAEKEEIIQAVIERMSNKN